MRIRVLFALIAALLATAQVDADVDDYLIELFSPGSGMSGESTLSEWLDNALMKADDRSDALPGQAADELAALARIARHLGRNDDALEIWQRVEAIRSDQFGAEHLETAMARQYVGELLARAGRFTEGLPMLESACGTIESELSASVELGDCLHLWAIGEILYGNYREAEELLGRSLEQRRAEDDPLRTASSLNNLGVLLRKRDAIAEATAADQEALELRIEALGADHDEVAASLNNLSIDHQIAGDLRSAEKAMMRALTIWRQARSGDDIMLATALINLGEIGIDLEEFMIAGMHLKEAQGMLERLFGDDHVEVAYATHGLAKIAQAQGRTAEAMELYKKTITLRESSLAPTHADLAQALEDYRDFLTQLEDSNAE